MTARSLFLLLDIGLRQVLIYKLLKYLYNRFGIYSSFVANVRRYTDEKESLIASGIGQLGCPCLGSRPIGLFPA